MPSLYKYQAEAVAQLLAGKHIIVAGTGMGKTSMAMVWAEQRCKKTSKHKVLVVTTASKCRARAANGDDDFTSDARLFCSPSFVESLSSSFSLISWHKLASWVNENWRSLDEYVVVLDEIQRGSAGASSGMGRAFLKLAKRNPDWAGFTGTPGDTWLKFYPYFTACGLVRNKTSFMNEYANVRTYKGYPEIVGWRNENKLRAMWARISYAPDASKALQELPKESYRTIIVSKPRAYSTTLKTRLNSKGEFMDTTGAMVAELRRLCFTKDKQEWVSDFVADVESGAVFFYNYVATGDALEQIIKKALPKDAKVWRIDGKHHDIPTAETIGKKDMVLCQWQSGSEALNLQFLHYWVGIELCYSNSILQQSMGRIRRIGQEHPMFFYRLITEGTIEVDIVKALRDKKDFSEKNWCIANNLTKEE